MTSINSSFDKSAINTGYFHGTAFSFVDYSCLTIIYLGLCELRRGRCVLPFT